MTAAAPPVARRLAAARLLLRLERRGISLRVVQEGAEPRRALRWVACWPEAFTEDLRAAIAELREPLVELLEPAALPVWTEDRTARLVAHAAGWSSPGSLTTCAVCGEAWAMVSPDGVARHPSCDPLLGVVEPGEQARMGRARPGAAGHGRARRGRAGGLMLTSANRGRK